jgi:hypothetical protein
MARLKHLAPVGFFKCDWVAPPLLGDLYRVAVLFKVPEYAGATELADLFETIALGPLVPDLVLLLEISLRGDDQTLSDLFADPLVADARTRVAGRIPVVIAKLGLATSEFALELTDTAFNKDWQDLKTALLTTQDEWFAAGLKHVFSPDRVVITAPAGYQFLKPSKSRSSYFVRAEQGLLTSGEVFYVAACIWRKLISHDTFDPHRVSRIFIDTIGIAPVAFALRELFRGSGLKRAPLVESFHSYDGMESIRSPLPGSSICLISASTSMGLHRDWMKAHKVSEMEVLTLITIGGAKDSHRALCTLPVDLAGIDSVSSAKFDIRIEGETFVPSPEPPKQVTLGQVHKRDELVSQFCELRSSRVFDVYRLDDRPIPRQRALFVDGAALVATHQFKTWFKRSLNQFAKSVTRVLIHLDDAASTAMAEQAKAHLDEILATPVRLLKASVIGREKFDIADANAGILVVASVIARGGSLLNLSRNLRGLHFGPRLYLVGYQVVENSVQLTALVANLRQTKHGASVDVQRFGSAAIGSGLVDSYIAEQEFLSQFRDADEPIREFVQKRLKYLTGATSGEFDGALWPRGERATAPLKLRKDFLLWPSKYAPGPYHPEVIATMAVTVENVRVPRSFSDEYSLYSPVLRHVALSPQNFLRFDDGIIQGALLRCAERAEIDYRDSAESSRYMRQFVLRLVENLNTDRAEAILEFLLAVRTGRMMLRPKDEQELFNVAAKVVGGSRLHKLVRFLATADARVQPSPL